MSEPICIYVGGGVSRPQSVRYSIIYTLTSMEQNMDSKEGMTLSLLSLRSEIICQSLYVYMCVCSFWSSCADDSGVLT